MANAYYTAAFIAAGLILIGVHDCRCDDQEEDLQELWEFLAPVESDNDPFHVVPGELSPLVPSSITGEMNRRKRKIEDKAEEERKTEETRRYFRAWRHANEARNKCPIGYIRVFVMCMKHPSA